ncbi:MAG: M18 family aminopeptidase [Clostridium sp.]|nr:M18 family aminopeptidase [Clostridium sp.]
MEQKLIDFIYDSPTSYHATSNVVKRLEKIGYTELKEKDKWEIKKLGKYYVKKNDSAIIAFQIGNGDIREEGFRIIGAHTDSPSFRIKPSSEIIVENKYVKLNTEGYGGAILNTWFDRPLALAGRVVIRGKTFTEPITRLINVNRPILVIPNLAIHMNRNINEGVSINKQRDTLPILGFVNQNLEKNNYLLSIIAEELNIDKEDILDFDLFLYEYEKGCLCGANNEFISSSRLDDLWMVYAGLEAILEENESTFSKMLICTDNEEIGSYTAQGAESNFVKEVLERIIISLKLNREDYYRALSKTIMISSDLAHAVHPNYTDKHDLTNRPLLGEGPVLKLTASGSYATEGVSASIFKELCQSNNIPYQIFVNRSDMRGGSTIGPMMATKFGIKVIDMGNAILGMHSIRELGAVVDNKLIIDLFRAFFS